MKHYLIKRTLVAGFILFAVPPVVFAQNEEGIKDLTEKEERAEKKESKDKKNVQQIIITRKGDKAEKTVIEIKGDKVTVNGKDVSKDDNITVNLNNLSDLNTFEWKGMNDLGKLQSLQLKAMNDQQYNLNFDSDLNNEAISLFNEDANRAMLGVTTDEDDRGAKITTVSKGSAAEKAGLKVGDVITKIGNEEVDDADDVSKAVRKHKPGERVTVTVLRNDKEQKITAELGKWKGVRINNLNATIGPGEFEAPATPYKSFGRIHYSGAPKLGLTVQDTDDGKGVKVLQVAEESNAAKAGVKQDDIITRINDEDVNSTDEVKAAMQLARTEPNFKLQVLRNGKPQTLEVRIPRKLKTTDL